MLANFFTFDTESLPPGSGFGLYSPVHLAALLFIALFCAAAALGYRRFGEVRRRRVLKAAALIILALEAVKQPGVILANPGAYPMAQLPLHLCGLTEWLVFIHAFWPNPNTGEILYSLGLPGAAAALCFPDWAAYPLFNFYCLQSFIIHMLLLSVPLMLLAGGQFRPFFNNLWRPAAFLALTAPLLALANSRWGTNFYFLSSGSARSPLQFLMDNLSYPLFLLAYAGLVLGVWVFLYLPWAAADAAKYLRRKSGRLS